MEMDGSAVVVLGLTLVLIIAVGAAMYVYLVSPGLSKPDDDEEVRRDDLDRVVHGVNRALRSSYDYDLGQDKRLDDASDANKKQDTAIAGLKEEDREINDNIKDLEKRLDSQESSGAFGAIASGLGGLLSGVDFGSMFGGSQPPPPPSIADPEPVPASDEPFAPY